MTVRKPRLSKARTSRSNNSGIWRNVLTRLICTVQNQP